jgi:hypothetical protein
MQIIKLPGVRRTLWSCLLLTGLLAAQAASAQSITVANRNVNTNGPWGPLTAVYVLTAGGDIVTSDAYGFGNSVVGSWLTPKTNMSNFQVRANSTCNNGPPNNTWVPLGVTRNWSKTAGGPSPSSASCSLFFEISAIANPTVILGSASVSLLAWY